MSNVYPLTVHEINHLPGKVVEIVLHLGYPCFVQKVISKGEYGYIVVHNAEETATILKAIHGIAYTAQSSSPFNMKQLVEFYGKIHVYS